MKIINEQSRAIKFTVAIVVSRFNQNITDALLKGALRRLSELTIPDDAITVVYVPGAVEIPLIANRLAGSNKYDAIVCLGAVIRGETSHYDYVCSQVSDGCQRVALEQDIPVIFGVLTTENEEQAFARAGGAHGNKGSDAIDAAAEMVAVLRELM